MNTPEQFLIYTLSNQRRVQGEFRKLTGLNRSDLEIMAFASQIDLFTAYQVYNHFVNLNIQQARKAIQKLVKHEVFEILNSGSRGKAAIYCLSVSGKRKLEAYTQLWISNNLVTG
jgi:hypothetical protein